jgi:PRTRC genetic system protein B
MRVATEIGEQRKFVLSRALLIYEELLHKQEYFATVHDIILEDGTTRQPQLGPGSLLTTEFLITLAAGLQQPAKAVVLPENVLAYASELLVWWTPPRLHPMFFSDGAEDRAQVNGRLCPHPALVWKVKSGVLYLRALVENARPASDTALRVAPYWNTEPQAGNVCQGSMPRPDATDLTNLREWESGFFVSRFSHPSGMGKLTTHPGGFIGLWTELVGQPQFPVNYLVPARQTLQQFVAGD